MAKVTVNPPEVQRVWTEKVINEGSVTLTLTHEEANALVGLLGHSCGDPFWEIYSALETQIGQGDGTYNRIRDNATQKTIGSYRLY